MANPSRSLDAARQRIIQEIEDSEANIASLKQQLIAAEESVNRLKAKQAEEGVPESVVKFRCHLEKHPREIAAEDALDTIVRLENSLKIVQRHNVLLQRENQTQEKALRDRTKVLEKTAKEEQHILSATGWTSETAATQEEYRRHVEEMINLEHTLNKELAAANVFIQKKEKLIESLSAELEKKKEKEEEVYLLYNSIRVADRDCQEQQVKIDELRDANSKNDGALEVATKARGSTSIECLQGDKDFLQDAVTSNKNARRRQDDVIRAQLYRARQLQTRLDIIMAAMRDLKLDKEFERTISKSSLVPSAVVDEPMDAGDIVPEQEFLPMETFWLLQRDNAAMLTSIARKDMMVLEKDAVIKSMEAKLATFTQSLNLSTEQHDILKQHKAVEMDDLQYSLQDKHEEYRREIQKLLHRNMELKNRLLRQPPPQTIDKLPNRGRMVF